MIDAVAAEVDDDIGYVDDGLYEDVLAFFSANDRWSGEPLPADQAEGHGLKAGAAGLVLQEARALDARDYEGWLGLYGPRCLYWVPRTELVGDPRLEPSLHFDDHRRLADRVALIRTGHLHAQTPPSRTCRVVANIECRAVDADLGVADVHSTLVVHAHRRGRSEQYVGRQFHRLERSDDRWRIRYRVLLLIDRDGPQGNTTFIL